MRREERRFLTGLPTTKSPSLDIRRRGQRLHSSIPSSTKALLLQALLQAIQCACPSGTETDNPIQGHLLYRYYQKLERSIIKIDSLASYSIIRYMAPPSVIFTIKDNTVVVFIRRHRAAVSGIWCGRGRVGASRSFWEVVPVVASAFDVNWPWLTLHWSTRRLSKERGCKRYAGSAFLRERRSKETVGRGG